jgi:1,4-dihydroxy-6-naphthoate synthase
MSLEIKIAHSPDSDDAFMFYALATDKFDTGGLRFTHVLKDIETLNRTAMTTRDYDVTAVSFHAFAYISDHYALLPHGASIGDGYGPILVAREMFPAAEIARRRIGVPGTLTSAFLALSLHTPRFEYEVIPFDQIIEAVTSGRVDAGLLIHEGQLTYHDQGLQKILDLGAWWKAETGLPLPMGGNAIRRDLGEELRREISQWLRRSIEYSLAHRRDALAYALQFAREMPVELADRFVEMWVNQLTLDYGERGREAVCRLLEEGYRRGLIPHEARVDFVD